MPCEVVLLRVDFFKMAAVAMETDKMLTHCIQGHFYFQNGHRQNRQNFNVL
jgi:hypothetical protein